MTATAAPRQEHKIKPIDVTSAMRTSLIWSVVLLVGALGFPPVSRMFGGTGVALMLIFLLALGYSLIFLMLARKKGG